MKDLIRAKALEFGFDVCGFAAADADPVCAEHLGSYVAEGRHGDMGWMEERMAQRASPTGLWAEARSVIVLGSNYGPAGDPLALLAHPERGNISVYARGKDYHDTVKKRLKQFGRWLGEETGQPLKVFVDTAPVMEKPLAQRAGLGWQGKHTNMVSRSHGSWLFLSEIYTSLALDPDPVHPDRCGACAACIEACPTQAITPHAMDARRCVSYLTIEHKGPIPAELRPLLGNRIYGCDDCLAVCPWNKFAQATKQDDFFPRAELLAPHLADLVELDDASFRELFAGSPIKRVGRDRFVRNVLIAIGNGGDAGLVPAVLARLDDASPLVRGAAAWALRQVAERLWCDMAQKRIATEEDQSVVQEWTGA